MTISSLLESAHKRKSCLHYDQQQIQAVIQLPAYSLFFLD